MTRVVVAAHHDLVRSQLAAVLTVSGCEVVGVAADGPGAVEVAARTAPDVVLMDFSGATLDGISATCQITSAGTGTRVLMLTEPGQDTHLFYALKAGAAGFLRAGTPPGPLLAAIETVAAGEALLAPGATRRLIEEHVHTSVPGDGASAAIDRLTDREREVLGLVARGLSNGEIAFALGAAEDEVALLVQRILAGVDLSTRVQLVVLAYEVGLLQPCA